MHFFIGRHNFGLLPLTLLVTFTQICNGFSSHHRIRHQHHSDRFKRQQGANLFLAGSYVYEGDGGGPDEGPWGNWSASSPCSRTCGGGVSSEVRQCLQGYQCRGPTARHFSCNTQDCLDSGDFRAQQCSEFDSVPFDGFTYQWVPYTKAVNPCELNCMPRKERFYFRHRAQVVDGTRCSDENLDVCVQGKCQPVGCDMMLGSTAREDRCRICGGDGSTCNTVTGKFDQQDLQVGYNDILLIPRGATNILVEEIEPSNNYLAVRNTSGHYYLNGNWRIDFPRSLEFAGCKFHYERSPQGFSAPDKVTCLGPIEEALFIVLLQQDRNVGVDYEYSLPTNIQPGRENESYSWTFDQFSPCSTTCGGGVQQRNVKCARRQSLDPVDRNLCDPAREPPSTERCAEIPCEAQWVPYPWSQCSAACGEEGFQTRQFACQQTVANGLPNIVDESECANQPKPSDKQPCNRGKVCAQWHEGPWKPCDHLCGDGTQTRRLLCHVKNGTNIELFDDAECADPKPETEKKCNVRPCEGVDWITSQWSGCDKCGLTNETRTVHCATSDGKIYDDELCDVDNKPVLVRECSTTSPSCDYAWYASQWSECSVQCGNGIQTRTLFCGVKTDDGSVTKVDNEKCETNKTYETMRNCTGEQGTCLGEWFSGPWTQCSKPCGGGIKTKKVVCLKDLEVVDPSLCGEDKIVFAEEECNIQACSEDTIIPTDVGTTVDESETASTVSGILETTTESDEEYEIVPDDECDDGEWVGDEELAESEEASEASEATEVSAASDLTTAASSTLGSETSFSLDDLMLSDAPSSPDGSESSIDTSMFTGSGDTELTSVASSNQTDLTESTLEEGSGDTSDTQTTGSEADFSSSSFTETGSSFTSGSESSDQTSEISTVSGSTEISSDVTIGSSEDTTSVSTVETTTASDAEGSTEATSTDVSSSSSSEATSTDISSSSSSSSSEATSTDISSSSSEATSTDISSSSSDSSSSSTSESNESSSSTESESTTDGASSTTEFSSSSSSFASSESSSSLQSTTPDLESTSITSLESSATILSSSSSDLEGTTTSESSSADTDSPAVAESGYVSPDQTVPPFVDETEPEESTLQTNTVSGSTDSVSGSTDSVSGSTDSVSGSTDSVSESTDVSVSGSTESVSEITGTTGTSEEGTGQSSVTTDVTETNTASDIDIWSTTTESGVTEIDLWSTTSITEIFETRKPRMCKRRKVKDCKSSIFGCCWDKVTPAEGPFDKGCPTPRTCKESKFGCCEDGVSAALGRKFKGCPSTHCNETLFGCCSDKKTAAEGSNNEGCPPPPPACLKSKHGCCKDKVTPAKGPKQKGCEEKPLQTRLKPDNKEDCKNTTHGCCPDGVQASEGEFFKGCDIFKDNCTESYFKCCPDGVTSAQGPSYRGCKIACATSQFNCCPDGVTPAHGPSGEGCCLAGPFGCCPDNVLPARGPNLEGCGCQYSPYGCCPDNSTAARGYNKEGCGCQHTEHGCCPDNYTPAAGPEYGGCLCHTFQFGCCPDGVSIAKGPHQQGCGCRNTEFGCCTDDRTPARGPNYEGCGCDSSKYGCCPDGVSEAQDDNFAGCTETIPDLQESCAQPKERGSCRNYTVKWYFDMEYAGCSRFWYGGCDGNDNRFRSKDDCDGICVNPEGTDRCKLPKVAGPCDGYYPQWYYDKERKVCSQFVYGGCLGNNNRFKTREECMSLCVKDDSVDACEQEKFEGPCKGNYRRWFFDKNSKSCQQFAYGGCQANNNNFPTEEACKQQCSQPGRKKDHCSLPRAQGNCTAREPRWYFDIPDNRCLPFYYSGCNGNDNNFGSREACETDCPKEIQKDLCQLPADIGTCGNYTQRWYFDTREKNCLQFYYGGCAGNGNNFELQEQCEQRCKQGPEPSQPQPPAQESQEPFSAEMCFLPSETGPCQKPELRYFYDRNDGVCKRFTYGGCDGNRNNFRSVDECRQYCGNAQDLCSLPPVVGPCNSEYVQYYYEARTDSCETFTYGGCEGNYNRFESQSSCEQRCRRRPRVEEPPQTQAPPPASDVAMCYEPADPGNCTDNLSVYFFEFSSGICTPFTYTGCGGNGNRFNSEEQCERQCGSFRGQDVCNMDRDPGPCRGSFSKYYYERSTSTCNPFLFGGCNGNGNRFSSLEECQQICLTREENKNSLTSAAVCQLPADSGGPCQVANHKRWYFDNERGDCMAFIFTGCGGNLNNFKTFQSCSDFCRDFLTTAPEPPVDPDNQLCQAQHNECATLRCPYGVDAFVEDNCNRCKCHDPCTRIQCSSDSQCAIDINRNRTTAEDPDYVAVCRKVNKEGQCPNLQAIDNANCNQECRNDADCQEDLKCCNAGCSTACVPPYQEISPGSYTQAGYTPAPIVLDYQAPKVDVEVFEPQVTAPLGDQVILNCAITGNPTPKITWMKDDLLIDGTQPKYRIKLDQSLQIVTLYKTDSGIYLCTADNRVGDPITNKIELNVVDGPQRPATVLDLEDSAPVVVSLNAPATLNCLALGNPLPAVTWWKDDSLVPLGNKEFLVRKDHSLLIHSVKLSNLGIYTCQVYNGVGKAASWSVVVKARGPYHSTNPNEDKYLKYIVDRPEVASTTTTTTVVPPWQVRLPEPPANYYKGNVPVRTNITLDTQKFRPNSDILIPCIVEGFPVPQIAWYKDGVALSSSERIQISASQLVVLKATKADAGTYECEATNAYSRSASRIEILINGNFIDPNCKDNRFFANCRLIVEGRFCSHKYYAKFCCRSCMEAGQLGGFDSEQQSDLRSNAIV